MNWPTIESTLQAWAVRASGLNDAKVIWTQQNGPRPAPSFVELRHDGLSRHGQIPELVITDATDPQPGADIQTETRAQHEFSLTVHVYTVPVIGASAAQAIAQAMAEELQAESELDNFDAAGLAVVEIGTVQNLTGLLETEFEGRASFDVRLRLADGFLELGTYIATVDGPTGTITS